MLLALASVWCLNTTRGANVTGWGFVHISIFIGITPAGATYQGLSCVFKHVSASKRPYERLGEVDLRYQANGKDRVGVFGAFMMTETLRSEDTENSGRMEIGLCTLYDTPEPRALIFKKFKIRSPSKLI
jgi:hypothetical protein